ncbi:MAG: SusC/RagA family TonB-linked outer membrane protein [Gemmatimonadaceae bacterium]
MNQRRMLVMAKTSALSAAILLAAQGVAGAQTGSVSGTVIHEATQRPLGGVQVGVAGVAGRGAVTDGNGRFTIAGLSGETVVLSVRYIGYRPVTDTVRVGRTDIRIALAERALELDQLVVTGTAGGSEKRELGTSVASVNVANVMAQTTVPTVEGLLNGRAAGVNIIATTGQVGSGAQIRIRGVGTFSLSSTPLVYIDGIRTDNGQTGIVGRFNDIAPEEIESIEVLKGPAASTLYGTEAARGVINIITKKGEAGAPKFTFIAQSGSQWFNDAAGRFPTNYWINPADGTLHSINFVNSEAAHGTPLFQNGPINNFVANASGGNTAYRYFVAGEYHESNGIVPNNGRDQKNVRTNLSLVPNSKLDIETNVGYLLSRTKTAPEGGGSGPMWGVFALPQRTTIACPTPAPRGCGWSRGSIVGPPEVQAATQRWQDVRRFTGSGSIKYDPFSWMSNRFLLGTDYTVEDINSYLPYQKDSVIVFFLGANFDGNRAQTTQQTTFNTFDYAGTVHFDVRPQIQSKSTLGVQYYTNQQVALAASGTHYPSPGLSSITALGTKTAPTSTLIANNTLGAFGQQEFAFSNRLFVTGAVRVDNNSAFGSKASFTTYPKASLSWVASDEPRVKSLLPTFVDELRFRGAYGGSGQQPQVNSALQTLNPVAGPGGTILTNNAIGNAELKPERVLGSELGFETGLFRDRIGVDFTYFNEVSRDAILARKVAPSTGFGASSQFVNAGQINKHGIELSIKGQVVNQRRYGWDMQFNLANTSSKIIRLTGQDTLINVTGGNTGIGTVGDVFHRVGYSPFDLFTYRVVSATYDPATKTAINPMCDDARGGVMPCFVPGTSTIQAPLMYFGHSIPATTGSLTNSFRYGPARLYVLVDFQTNFRKTDTNAEQVCQAFLACIEDIYPERYSPAIIATAQNGGVLQDYFIRSASFAKLREVTLSLDAPSRLAARVGAKELGFSITGRNLATRTHYSGIDPETSIPPTAGGNNNNIGTDQTEYPQLMSVLFSLRLTY